MSTSFDSLADVRPGITRVSEAAARFGTATVEEVSGGGFYYSFAVHGVHVLAYGSDSDAPDPVVTEVRLRPPSRELLPCGVRLGQPKPDAIRLVRRGYRVTAEHDDSIYFRPTAEDDLLGCVEFMAEDVVVGIELFLDVPPSEQTV